jgi:hypothetical protein
MVLYSVAYLAAAKRPAPGLRMGMGMLIRWRRWRCWQEKLMTSGTVPGGFSRCQEATSQGSFFSPLLCYSPLMRHTGEISVRFHRAPTDTELTGFAAEHGLRLLRRNELVPQQAVFQPAAGNLHEIVHQI